MLDLPETLTAARLEFQDHSVPGYRNRRFAPIGMIWHHTASPAGNRMPHRLYTNGREGLPGPVVQLGIDRDAQAHVYTSGLANHAGRANRQAITEIGAGNASDLTAAQRGLKDSRWARANRNLYGIEIDLNGTGEHITDNQLVTAINITAAIFAPLGWHAGHLSDHQRITRRKIDIYAPNFPPWPALRDMVDAEIARLNRPPVTITPEYDPAIIQEPIIAQLSAPRSGTWLLAESGSIYSWGGATYHGRITPTDGQAARLEPHGDGYTIVTTDGQRHDRPA